MDVGTILISAGVGAVASVVTAYATAHLTAKQELRRWRSDLAEKYAALVADQPAKAQALARQFAIGVLIVEWGEPGQRDKVFVAPHTRITAGRDPQNELVLPVMASSRRHFAISADHKNVYVEDLGSANGTFLNDLPVHGRTALNTGDVLSVDDSLRIEFQRLSSNI